MREPAEPWIPVSIKTALDTTATLAMLVTTGVLLWVFLRPVPAPAPTVAATSRPEPVVPVEPLVVTGLPALGPSSAPVVVIEFSDFQCPFCARFVKDTLPALKQSYVDTGRVQIVFQHLPLPMHDRARAAAEFAACAATQGRFWAVHDLLFEDPAKLAEADLRAYAARAGVDLGGNCVTGAGAARVTADLALAKTLRLNGTPVFLVGRREADGRVKVMRTISGARPAADFVRVLDEVGGA